VLADRRAARLTALGARLSADGLDALLVTHLPNIRYLTGFSGSAGLLLVDAGGSATLVTDFRYETQAVQEVGNAATVEIEPVNVWERLARLLEAQEIGTLGVEGDVLTLRDAERIGALTRAARRPTTGLVERLRAVKDADEIEAIREAGALALEALAAVLPTVRVGLRELDVAARLEHELRIRGSEWHPFQTIVASGSRAALPHARSSERTIGAGEWLLIDFGAQLRGYCADITRTFVVGGRADARQREVYEAVREAQLRARTRMRAGMTGREADALAREPLAAGGFGAAFGHSLGHGLGLEVHEAPRLSATNGEPLPAGAVVTVEPGVYLPGWGGVRLEDDIVLRSDRAELLTDGRTELLELT
jgi:Xaa-Pro aminopeptidase